MSEILPQDSEKSFKTALSILDARGYETLSDVFNKDDNGLSSRRVVSLHNRQLQETVDMTLMESFGVHSALMQWKRIGNEKIVHTETPSRFLYRITGSGSNLQSL